MNFPLLFFFLLFLPCTLPTTFELRRASSSQDPWLQNQPPGNIDFQLLGNYRASTFGYYWTTVKIGSPPLEYNLVVDTGTSVTWVDCVHCLGCPDSNLYQLPLHPYDIHNSTSGSTLNCSNQVCQSFLDSNCSSSPKCQYNFHYIEGLWIKGHLVSDLFYLEGSVKHSFIFGCTDIRSRHQDQSYAIVDGVLGLGPHNLSFISQLSSQRATPMIFAHCLRGRGSGGGTLIIGEIHAPGLVYTQMNTSRQVYAVNLQRIAVNGKILPIDPALFALSDYGGTIVNSAANFIVLADLAYDSVVHLLTVPPSLSVRPVHIDKFPCFNVSSTSSIDEIFPTISFIFEGGASMILTPNDYLLLLTIYEEEGVDTWCSGFRKGGNETVIGELALKSKIVVYDIAHQRLGWTAYNCSLDGNVHGSGAGRNQELKNCRKYIFILYVIIHLICNRHM